MGEVARGQAAHGASRQLWVIRRPLAVNAL
jgi:hypothetical protein